MTAKADFSEMSRGELLEVARRQAEQLIHQGSNPSLACCPFCLGSGLVAWLKLEVRRAAAEAWAPDVTVEEYRRWQAREPARQAVAGEVGPPR